MKLQVVFHIDELDKWDLLLKNVENFLKELDASNLTIEVLANAVAVSAYLKSSKQARKMEFARLNSKNVRFVACQNSLNSLKIQSDELFDFVKIVPSGVVELAKKQNEGFSYIKP